MQACVSSSRSYLTPVRDEEAESQRKARSRQARQTRRSTQGVTLSELKEALRVFSPSQLERDRRVDDASSSMDNLSVPSALTEETEPNSISQTPHHHHSHMRHEEQDKEGNWREKAEGKNDLSVISPAVTGACGITASLTNSVSSSGVKWRDQNENTICTSSGVRERGQLQTNDNSLLSEQDRTSSRTDAGGVDSASGRTSSYTRRENRLASLSKTDDNAGSNDYKRLYEFALGENEKLKSRLEESKQELAKIRSQLDTVTQKQDRISERSSAIESEKREKQALEKRVSDMEEELKVLAELKTDNQRLKDENGALIRVISKLSK